HGSEALVGYKYAEALAAANSVDILACAPADVPYGATLHAVDSGPCNFNDVAARSLLRFEMKQLPRAVALNRRLHFDVVHRVTPSWIGNPTLLPAMQVPLVVGPLLAGTRPQESFGPYLNRVPLARESGRAAVRRSSIADRLASRARTM